MLYIFAGFPRSGLNAGGIQHLIERVEEMGVLEHNPTVQTTKEHTDTCRISDACLALGVEWRWFSERWTFGNGVTIHKTTAMRDERLVVHGTDKTLDEYLRLGEPVPLAALQLVKQRVRHEGWETYEQRWRPGTCPQQSHLVHLTWLITGQPLPEAAYERLCEIIERGARPEPRDAYEDKHFSEIRRWDGKRSQVLAGV